jgi:hypothetical protein
VYFRNGSSRSFFSGAEFIVAELWHDINDPGAFAGKPEPEESTSAAETEQTGQESPEKQEPEVKLVSAVWEVRETGFEFNKKCNLKVSAEFLKETFRKKITCQLFVVFNGQEEDLHHQVDAELGDDGAATVEMTLYYGNDYYNALPDNPEALCQYKAKVTHPTATAELESALLDMPPCMAVDFIEIADIHFNHNCALPCLDTKGELIDLLARAFVYHSWACRHQRRSRLQPGHFTAARRSDQGAFKRRYRSVERGGRLQGS